MIWFRSLGPDRTENDVSSYTTVETIEMLRNNKSKARDRSVSSMEKLIATKISDNKERKGTRRSRLARSTIFSPRPRLKGVSF